MPNSILSGLIERGMVANITNPVEIERILAGTGIHIYIGFDPTANSLHVGSLLPIMFLAHLQNAGHVPITVIGGATGSIGDPSGRNTERQLLTPATIEVNSQAIKRQLEKFLTFDGDNAAIMVNNADWTKDVSILEFLRDIGKYFTVNNMLAKESVKRRIEDAAQGITLTEFMYMTLQAFDFLQLYQQYGCLIQAGGNDQLGNIIAGIDLVRRKCGGEVYGMTVPLILTANGEKFGKSAGNAVWLDPLKTSPYKFYQFWVRTDDRDVERYLKLFTFLSLQEIQQIAERHLAHPEKREAQKVLAEAVTKIVHGDEGLNRAIQATEVFFGGAISNLSSEELMDIFTDVPASNLSISCLNDSFSIVDLLVLTQVCPSRSESRRAIENGGIYLNNSVVKDKDFLISATSLISAHMLVLRTGKKNYHLVYFDK
jgi:tyrosyl-tRNA synthetase